jgi:hypothetical protein
MWKKYLLCSYKVRTARDAGDFMRELNALTERASAMPKDLALKARIVAAQQDRSRSSLITEILEAALLDLEAWNHEDEEMAATEESGG